MAPKPDQSGDAAARRLRQLAGRGPGGAGLEGGAVPDETLSADRRRQSREALREALQSRVVEAPRTSLGSDAAAAFLDSADRALSKLELDGPEAALTPQDEMVLEAVVEIDGSRPSALVRNGTVDATDPRLGHWAGDLVNASEAIGRAIAATGRILRGADLSENRVFGTAWMLAPGLAATAKHVVEALYVQREGQWIERFGHPISLDFHVEADAAPRPAERIAVRGVHWASPDLINNRLDLANLDIAVLELEAEGPPPLTLSRTLEFPIGEPRIHVIGHPRAPQGFELPGQETFDEIMRLVFGDSFGVKRWAPGHVTLGPGSLPKDVNGRVMTHDASTLAGASGSPVFDFTGLADRVVGLHYAGRAEEENYAHPTASIHGDLAFDGVRVV